MKKTMKKVIETLEQANISVFEYTENKKLCGYELNTYTNAGVNQIIFVDFRNTEKDPTKASDFIELYNERIDSINVDEEIEINRQSKSYRDNFTLTESLIDFKEWKEELQAVFSTKKPYVVTNEEAEAIEFLKWAVKNHSVPYEGFSLSYNASLGGATKFVDGKELTMTQFYHLYKKFYEQKNDTQTKRKAS